MQLFMVHPWGHLKEDLEQRKTNTTRKTSDIILQKLQLALS